MTTPATDTGGDAAGSAFDPYNVNLADTTNPDLARDVVCYLQIGTNEYNGSLGARISSIFVILIVSTAATFFPVMAARIKSFKIPLYVYLFVRYFGAGVIIATAFIHLLDPAYAEIGPNTCVGMTGGWAQYSWPPVIAMGMVIFIFLIDLAAARYVEVKYGVTHDHVDVETLVTGNPDRQPAHQHKHDDLHNISQHKPTKMVGKGGADNGDSGSEHENEKSLAHDNESGVVDDETVQADLERSFRTQISAFLVLEFGVIFHSVIIGLNLGTAGDEFSTLYPVLVFHQSFEGLGIGARLSAIPFPRRLHWMPWALCAAYGLTTPISIAIGLGLATTYNGASFTANIISGLLDSLSAGILIYTGLVELLARDFLFDPQRTKDNKRLSFMVGSLLLGTGLMALLGKWA